MKIKERMDNGLCYQEYGFFKDEHKQEGDALEKQRMTAKDLQFKYNNTMPSDMESRNNLVSDMFKSVGKNVFIEPPVHLSYGVNTTLGNNFYSNFNLTIVDDGEVFIGDDVMCAPNVVISATGHPVYFKYRKSGAQFSLPVKIGNDVWIGANVVILPGVTIGDRSVIGAGSVVTKDVPSDVIAVGNPCKVLRKIDQTDKEYFKKNHKIDYEFLQDCEEFCNKNDIK